MFNAWNPQINYIGKFIFYIPELHYLKSGVYPISSMNSVNKKVVFDWFQKEIEELRTKVEKAKQYGLNNRKERVETLHYEITFTNGYDRSIWFISFEILEEAKLLEKREFLG